MSRRNGFSMAELLVAVMVTGMLGALVFPAVSRGMEVGRRTACQSNFKQLGLIFKMYSGESKGMYPPLRRYKEDDCLPLDVSDIPTLFSPDGPAIFPEYLTDADLLVCPSDMDAVKVQYGEFQVGGSMNPVDPGATRSEERPTSPCRLYNISYNYYGWVIKPSHYLRSSASSNMDASRLSDTPSWLDDGFSQAFAGVLYTMATEGAYYPWIWDEDIHYFHADQGETTLYRIRDGVERFWITDVNNPSRTADAQSDIAVMHDMGGNPWVTNTYAGFNHTPGGGNVLYMDGHVSFEYYPGTFPMSRTWAWLFSDPRRLFAR